MIQYDTDSSPFFAANKSYCLSIEQKLKTINIDCHGFCNSYGYAIESDFTRNNLACQLKFHKHQTSRNGVLVPLDAMDYAGIKFSVTGLNKKFSVTVGQSSLARLFTLKKFKEKIPGPYFARFNYSPGNDLTGTLFKEILDYKIAKLKLRKGKLVCRINAATAGPPDIIAVIDQAIKNWM